MTDDDYNEATGLLSSMREGKAFFMPKEQD